MPKQTVRTASLTIPRYRTERTETPSPYGGVNVTFNHRVPNGTRQGTIELRIDVDALFLMLGQKALKSKGKRARGLAGCVEAVARNITETAPG